MATYGIYAAFLFLRQSLSYANYANNVLLLAVMREQCNLWFRELHVVANICHKFSNFAKTKECQVHGETQVRSMALLPCRISL